jgi:hypothetical protein
MKANDRTFYRIMSLISLENLYYTFSKLRNVSVADVVIISD